MWRCADRLESAEITCKKSASLHEDKLHTAILNIINSMIDNTEKLNEAVKCSIEESRNEIVTIDNELHPISEKIAEINTLRDTLLVNISGTQFDRLSGELKAMNEEESELKGKLDELKNRRDKIQLTAKNTAAARELFSNMQPMTSFDDMTIRKIIERITVNSKTEITVRFKGGFEVSGAVEK